VRIRGGSISIDAIRSSGRESTRRKVKESETVCFSERARCERVATLDSRARVRRERERVVAGLSRKQRRDEYGVASLPVRICVDPGGSRETKRIITRPRASVVPSGPSLTRPLARVSTTILVPALGPTLRFPLALLSRSSVCVSHARCK